MSQQQHGALAKALQRAHHNGLSVIGRGTWDSGGARFLVVGSASEPGRFHLVTIYPGRLVCDCPSRVLCTHRALAHEELAREAREAQELRMIADAIDRTRRELAAKLDELTGSAPAPASVPAAVALHGTAPLYRSNAGFSIWKS
ncbi:MAG TPA: hypothetical protein VF120_09165 [Ktedonobacterales bacterium]